MKKVLALIFALSVLIMSAGCGGSAGTAVSESGEAAGSGATSTAEPSGGTESAAEVSGDVGPWSGLPTTPNIVEFDLDKDEIAGMNLKFGFAQCVMDHPYRIDMVERAKTFCAEYGIEFVLMDGQGEPAKEVSNIENLIAMNVDAIIISSHGGLAITPALQQAADAEIPVVLIDGGKPYENWEFVTWMSTDDWLLGQGAAEKVVQELNDSGKVLLLEGTAGSSCTEGRRIGFDDYMADHPDIQIVGQQDCDWLRINAIDVTSNTLQSHPDLSAVYTHNDEMALGAIEAIEKAGKVPGQDILVYSAGDYQANAFEAIKAGKLQMTQIYSNDGAYACSAAAAHITGQEVPRMINLGTELADKSNVDTRTPAY